MDEEKIFKNEESYIYEIGAVVKDLNRTIEFFNSFGLGPFRMRLSSHNAAIVRGEKMSYQIKIAMSQQGPVQLQLLGYEGGERIFEDFIKEKGEGLYHIGFKVKDIEKTIEKFSQKGIDILRQDWFVGGGGVAYLDTRNIGGIIIKIIQLPVDYEPNKGVKYSKRPK